MSERYTARLVDDETVLAESYSQYALMAWTAEFAVAVDCEIGLYDGDGDWLPTGDWADPEGADDVARWRRSATLCARREMTAADQVRASRQQRLDAAVELILREIGWGDPAGVALYDWWVEQAAAYLAAPRRTLAEWLAVEETEAATALRAEAGV